MKKPLPNKKVNLSNFAIDASDGLMFRNTSIMEEKECISRIEKGIELCDLMGKLDSVSDDNEISTLDMETFTTLRRVASDKSLHDCDAFKEIKERRNEIKNAMIEIIKNPQKHDAKLDEYGLLFSKLARLFSGISS